MQEAEANIKETTEGCLKSLIEVGVDTPVDTQKEYES